MSQANKDLLLSFVDDVWNRGDLSGIKNYVHESYAVEGECVGVDWVDANVKSFRKGFPDLHLNVDELVESDTAVALLVRIRGTHLGEWKGYAPTGRSMD